MNTGFWNMDSGLAAMPRPGMTAYVVFFVYWAGKRIGAAYSTDSTHS